MKTVMKRQQNLQVVFIFVFLFEFVFVSVFVFVFVFVFVLKEEDAKEDAATCKRQELTPDRRKGWNRGEAPLMFGLECICFF